jgi:hypothetical protein
MSQTVAELLVGALEKKGVKQIFGLIGDSLNPLADAVRGSQIEWIGVRHEKAPHWPPPGRPQCRPHPSAGGRPNGERSGQARCSIRLRHRSEHALASQLNPAKRFAANHRLFQ